MSADVHIVSSLAVSAWETDCRTAQMSVVKLPDGFWGHGLSATLSGQAVLLLFMDIIYTMLTYRQE